MPTIYSECVKAGLKIDHHESDLYIEDSPKARQILFEQGSISHSSFRSSIDKKPWIEVPFAFDPFWDEKAQIAELISANA